MKNSTIYIYFALTAILCAVISFSSSPVLATVGLSLLAFAWLCFGTAKLLEKRQSR